MDAYFEWRMAVEQAWLFSMTVVVLGAVAVNGLYRLVRKIRDGK